MRIGDRTRLLSHVVLQGDTWLGDDNELFPFAVIGVHRWFHTPGDTLDCVNADLLVPVLEAHRRTIELAVTRGA